MLWNNKKFRIEKENSCGYNNGRNKKDKKIGRKESEKMDQLVDSLMEELNCNTVFTIPLFGGIDVLESVVVTWIIMAIIMIGSLIWVHGLKIRKISG